jgi:hypothetical protein
MISLEMGEAGITSAVAEFDGALYAFGVLDEPAAQPPYRQVAWQTTDGETWTEVSLPGTTAETIQGATGSGGRLVAPVPRWEPKGTAIYSSRDGTTWSLHSPEEAGLLGVILGPVVGHDGGFVAVGIDEGADPAAYPDGLARLYTSADGAVWAPVPGSELPPNARPWTLAAVGTSLYVGGHLGEGEWGPDEVALWRSDDGGPFARVDLGPAVADHTGAVSTILPTDRGLLVVVWWIGSEGEGVMPLARGADGIFAEMPAPDALLSGGSPTVLQLGDRLVMFGVRDGADHVWTWSPDG